MKHIRHSVISERRKYTTRVSISKIMKRFYRNIKIESNHQEEKKSMQNHGMMSMTSLKRGKADGANPKGEKICMRKLRSVCMNQWKDWTKSLKLREATFVLIVIQLVCQDALLVVVKDLCICMISSLTKSVRNVKAKGIRTIVQRVMVKALQHKLVSNKYTSKKVFQMKLFCEKKVQVVME